MLLVLLQASERSQSWVTGGAEDVQVLWRAAENAALQHPERNLSVAGGGTLQVVEQGLCQGARLAQGERGCWQWCWWERST